MSRVALILAVAVATLTTATTAWNGWRLSRAQGDLIEAAEAAARLQAENIALDGELRTARIKAEAVQAEAEIIANLAAEALDRASKAEDIIAEIGSAPDADDPAPDAVLCAVERLRGTDTGACAP